MLIVNSNDIEASIPIPRTHQFIKCIKTLCITQHFRQNFTSKKLCRHQGHIFRCSDCDFTLFKHNTLISQVSSFGRYCMFISLQLTQLHNRQHRIHMKNQNTLHLLATDHLLTVILLSKLAQRWFNDTTTQTQDQMQR